MADSLQKEKRLGNHAPLYNKTPVPMGADAATPAELGSVHLARGYGQPFGDWAIKFIDITLPPAGPACRKVL